jgi:nitrous oxide reductase accessory protein NosL
MREYDRCLPTLAAFKSPQEAEAYQQQHGGRVLSYSQVIARVREQ